MTLTADDLAGIDVLLAAPDAADAVLPELRRRFPNLSMTRCDASDVDAEQPFREYPRCSLYLVDGSYHCWQLTSDPARATGLVVVEHKVSA
jgi:hypothetical protein